MALAAPPSARLPARSTAARSARRRAAAAVTPRASSAGGEKPAEGGGGGARLAHRPKPPYASAGLAACAAALALGAPEPAAAAAAAAGPIAPAAVLNPVALVTCAWGFLYYAFMQLSGTAKLVGGSEAHQHWGQRAFGNLHEQSPAFLAALWVHALFVSPAAAATCGALWLALRCLYPVVWAANGEMTDSIMAVTFPSYFIVSYLFASTAFKVALGVMFPWFLSPLLFLVPLAFNIQVTQPLARKFFN